MFLFPKQKGTRRPPFNIFLVDPSSTGKTHLFEELKLCLGGCNATFHEETARVILAEDKATGDDLLNDQQMHMQFQKRLLRLEFDALPEKQRIGSFLHVSDRTALDALVYTKRYGSSNDVAEFQSLPEFQSCVELCQDANNSLVVLFPVIQELLKLDGTRMLGTLEEEQRFHQLFESTLQDLNVPYYVLGRNLETRGSDLLSRVHTKINTSMSEEEDQQHQQ